MGSNLIVQGGPGKISHRGMLKSQFCPFCRIFLVSKFEEYVAKKASVGIIRYIVAACHYARSTLYVSINNFLKFEPLTPFR